jgi:sulfur carrier protein
MPNDISVRVNDEPMLFVEGLSLSDLLQGLKRSDQGVAIAVNGEIVPKSQWGEYRLSAHSHVWVFESIAGG